MTFHVLISDPLSEEGLQPLREAENRRTRPARDRSKSRKGRARRAGLRKSCASCPPDWWRCQEGRHGRGSESPSGPASRPGSAPGGETRIARLARAGAVPQGPGQHGPGEAGLRTRPAGPGPLSRGACHDWRKRAPAMERGRCVAFPPRGQARLR